MYMHKTQSCGKNHCDHIEVKMKLKKHWLKGQYTLILTIALYFKQKIYHKVFSCAQAKMVVCRDFLRAWHFHYVI
jgi:hypothetical protein